MVGAILIDLLVMLMMTPPPLTHHTQTRPFEFLDN